MKNVVQFFTFPGVNTILKIPFIIIVDFKLYFEIYFYLFYLFEWKARKTQSYMLDYEIEKVSLQSNEKLFLCCYQGNDMNMSVQLSLC